MIPIVLLEINNQDINIEKYKDVDLYSLSKELARHILINDKEIRGDLLKALEEGKKHLFENDEKTEIIFYENGEEIELNSNDVKQLKKAFAALVDYIANKLQKQEELI